MIGGEEEAFTEHFLNEACAFLIPVAFFELVEGDFGKLPSQGIRQKPSRMGDHFQVVLSFEWAEENESRVASQTG